MTDIEILTKAVQKAMENGYTYFSKEFRIFSLEAPFQIRIVEPTIHSEDPFTIIFSHDFAKAFWGKGSTSVMAAVPEVIIETWRWRLQEMVTEEDPIKYLEKFL